MLLWLLYATRNYVFKTTTTTTQKRIWYAWLLKTQETALPVCPYRSETQKGTGQKEQKTAKPPLKQCVVADCLIMHRSRNTCREMRQRRLLPSGCEVQVHCTALATDYQLLCQKQPSSYQHSQPQLLLLSNTLISGNRLSRDLPKSGALKLHSQFPSCAHNSPSATLAALGLTQRSPLDRNGFFACFS